MEENRVVVDIESMEEEEFEEFFEKLEESLGSEDEGILVPDSKLDARSWVAAYVRMSEEIEYLEKEYVKALQEKYILPVKNRVSKLKDSQSGIKASLLEFLKESGEKKLAFPDVGTASKIKSQPKLLYPDDEDKLIEKLVEEKSKYIKTKPSLDKKQLLADYKATGDVPVDDLLVEDADETIRITKAKK